jgi:DNA-binding transcriptional MerR regulator
VALIRIGHIVDRLDVTPQTLRNRQIQGLIPPAQRTRTCYRVYRLEDLTTIEQTADRRLTRET